MKFSIFCTIIAIIGAVFTLSFLLMPAQTSGHYGVTPNAGGVSLGRLFAGALGSLVIVTGWLETKTRQAWLPKQHFLPAYFTTW